MGPTISNEYLPIAVYRALTIVTSKFHLFFPSGAHHSSHILLYPATEQTTSCQGQHSLTSEVGLETVSKRRAIKTQCLCLGSRAKCCLFPEAFLEHRVGAQLHVVHGAAATGRGPLTQGERPSSFRAGDGCNFPSLTNFSVPVCGNDSFHFSFTRSSKL